MAINNNFLNWHTAQGIAGYVDGPLVSEIADCIPAKDQYILPMRSGDAINFYFANSITNVKKVALIKNALVINPNIGLVQGNYGAVTLPENLPFGIYNFLIYQEVKNITVPWYTTSEGCEKTEENENTGYWIKNESQEYELVPTMVALSDCIRIGIHRNTSIVRFRNDEVAFGFDYRDDEDFYQQFRLHVEIVQPDYPLEESVYRQTNGYRRYGNVAIDEKQELRTDAFDQRTHQCMVSACKHGYFFVNGCQYFALGGYKIDPTERALAWTASIDIFTQDFDLRNFGCLPTATPTNGDYSQGDYSEEYSG